MIMLAHSLRTCIFALALGIGVTGVLGSASRNASSSAEDAGADGKEEPATSGGSMQLIGLLIEVLGTTLSVLGLNAQKHALMQKRQFEEQVRSGVPAEAARTGGCPLSVRWVLGFLLYFVGQAVESVALTYATQVLVTTITQISLVTNAVVARCLFNESFNFMPPTFEDDHRSSRGRSRSDEAVTRNQNRNRNGDSRGHCVSVVQTWDLGNCVAVLIGVLIAALTTPPKPDNMRVEHVPTTTIVAYFSAEGAIVYLGLCGVVVLALALRLFLLAHRAHCKGRRLGQGTDREGGYLFGLLAAINGTLVTVFAKPATTLLLHGTPTDWANDAAPIFVVLFAIEAISNVVILNLALARYEALLVYPVYSVVNTANTALNGLVLYQAPHSWVDSYHLPVWILGFSISLTACYNLVAYRNHDSEELQQNAAEANIRLERTILSSIVGAADVTAASRMRGGARPRPSLHMRHGTRTGTFVHSDYVSLDLDHCGNGALPGLVEATPQDSGLQMTHSVIGGSKAADGNVQERDSVDVDAGANNNARKSQSCPSPSRSISEMNPAFLEQSDNWPMGT